MTAGQTARRIGMQRAVVLVAALHVVLLSSCRSSSSPSPPDEPEKTSGIAFTEITSTVGIDFRYRSGREAGHYAIVETLGGGVALLDVDGDGRLDVASCGGGYLDSHAQPHGYPASLWLNGGEEPFREVSQAAGLSTGHYSHGCFSSDFDNDGFEDLLISGYGGLQLLQNQGDGTFRDVTRLAGLEDPFWSTGCAWGDLDGDGNLDLYVAHYVDWSPANHPRCPKVADRPREVCSPKDFAPLADRFFRSQGDGTFADVSESVGLRGDGKGLGVLSADIDLDGNLDWYVANDTTANFLYLNDGQGHLREVGVPSGSALDNLGMANGSMGVGLTDYNRDGRPDIGVSNYDRETFALYENLDRQFVHNSEKVGLGSVGLVFVGWGMAFFDMDHDGDEDLLVSNGHVLYHPENSPERQRPVLMELDAGRFRRKTFAADAYFGKPHHGRGLAVGDLDGDSDLDVVLCPLNEPLAVLRNDSSLKHPALAVRLVGRTSNRSAIGARIVLPEGLSGGMSGGSQVLGGVSYLSQHDRTLHLVLSGSGSGGGLQVYWPSGKRQSVPISRLADAPLGRVTLIEP